jgi:hypothetical protein
MIESFIEIEPTDCFCVCELMTLFQTITLLQRSFTTDCKNVVYRVSKKKKKLQHDMLIKPLSRCYIKKSNSITLLSFHLLTTQKLIEREREKERENRMNAIN